MNLMRSAGPGYRVNPKRKTKILFGKRYPNCEKAK